MSYSLRITCICNTMKCYVSHSEYIKLPIDWINPKAKNQLNVNALTCSVYNLSMSTCIVRSDKCCNSSDFYCLRTCFIECVSVYCVCVLMMFTVMCTSTSCDTLPVHKIRTDFGECLVNEYCVVLLRMFGGFGFVHNCRQHNGTLTVEENKRRARKSTVERARMVNSTKGYLSDHVTRFKRPPPPLTRKIQFQLIKSNRNRISHQYN